MCVKFKSSLSMVEELIAPCQHPLHSLDETEHLTHIPYKFCAPMPGVSRNTRAHIMSKHDVCEDG